MLGKTNMKKINEVNIKIERAVITKINVELKENGKAEWMITASLLTKQGKKITEFSTGNYHWDEKEDCEIPVIADCLGRQLFETFMPIIIKKINGELMGLPEPKKKI